jgi:hypothetical protein
MSHPVSPKLCCGKKSVKIDVSLAGTTPGKLLTLLLCAWVSILAKNFEI